MLIARKLASVILAILLVVTLFVNVTSPILADQNNNQGSFSIFVLIDGEWQLQGELSFSDYETLHLPLSNNTGQLKLRLVQKGHDAAYVDHVMLQKCGVDYIPTSAASINSGANILAKILYPEYDVCDGWESTLEIVWDSAPENAILIMRAMEEDLGEGHGAPLYYPWPYELRTLSSLLVNDGGIAVDGLLNEHMEPSFSVFWQPSSPHPDGYTYGWIHCDNKYLYAAVEVTPDNTADKQDWGALYVMVDGKLKEFRISENQTWGIRGFGYTSSVPYAHRIYEFKIPLSEINATVGSEIQFIFGAYGTAAVKLANVYVNGITGNDGLYDGSSPTPGSGTIGPKATIGGAKDVVSSGGTIHVAAGTYNEDIWIGDNLTLSGAGAQTTIISHYPVDRNESVIGISTGGQPIHPIVTISGFTIQNGYYHGLDYGSGAGISVSDNCTAYITACVITNNDALKNGGGIYNKGTLHLTDCTIANNAASSGGGVYNEGTLYVGRCCVSGNTAQYGGGGIYNHLGQVWLTNCTISGNSIWEFDFSGGGGIYNDSGTITILNCTIAYNSTSTFSGAVGGGFYDYSSQTITFKNTIVANNTAGYDLYNNGSFTVGGVISLGNNIDSEDSCGFDQPTDQINTNPQLGPLQNNGGPTSTHAIPASSPAYNNGTNTGAPTTDQRGVSRPQANICDIGAFELIYSISTATGTGIATFTTSAGALNGLAATASTPCGALSGFSFPHGFFSFTIANITPGSTVVITITLPSNVPTSTQYWKCINGQWVNVTSLLGDNDGDNVLTLTITDGGLGDADGQANGVITDPGGPATRLITSPTPQTTPSSTSSSDSSYLPERVVSAPAKLSVKYLTVQPQQAQANQPVTVLANIANSGDEAGKYTATLKINGEAEQTMVGKVGAHTAIPLKFEVIKDKPGTYTVDINGEKASFVIMDDGSKKPIQTKDWAIVGFIVSAIGIVVVSVLLIQRRRSSY